MSEIDTTQFLLEMARNNSYHIDVINREMGEVVAQIAFLTKFFWIIMTASIGAFVASTWSVLLYKSKRKNGNGGGTNQGLR